jgi:hypothetical protein
MKLPTVCPSLHFPSLFVSLALGMLFALASRDAAGADISWTSPTTVSGPNDVSATGGLVEAVNTGSDQNGSGATTTVNGVTFVGWPVNGGGVNFSPGGHFSFVAAPGYFHSSFNGFGSAVPPFSSLPASYQTLLGWGNFSISSTNPNDFTGALTLTISGLIVGASYQFQWWTNDSRPFAIGPVTATTGATGVSLSPNTTNAAGGLGQFATGTFVADGPTQSIVFSTTGNAVLVSGFQLRVIPEPSAISLLMTGAALAGATWRVRRSRS